MRAQGLFSAFVVSGFAVATHTANLSDGAPVKTLSWPSYLPGHGNLTVNVTAITDSEEGGNSTAMLDLITAYQLPEIFTIAKEEAGGQTCDGRVDFTILTDAGVTGELCLGTNASNYSDLAHAFQASNKVAQPAEGEICDCFCTCALVCMGLVLFAPLCWPSCSFCNT
ncbi:unnamed protein product [Discula destructiva]